MVEQGEQSWRVALKPLYNGALTGFSIGICSQAMLVPLFGLYCSPLCAQLRRSNPNGPQHSLNMSLFAKTFPQVTVLRTLTGLQFGLFEILRNKALATNDGMALTLCKEVACGLTAGAAEAYITYPVVNGVFEHIYPTEHSVMRSVVTRPLFVMRRSVTNMGMLASYNPSLRYFSESCGLSDRRAQLGASMVSAFFASACNVPVLNVLRHSNNGSSLDCVLQVLKSRGPLVFFTGLSRNFASNGLLS